MGTGTGGKLVLGRGGGCSGYFSFLSEVRPGLVGDTRREEQGTRLSVGKGIASGVVGWQCRLQCRFGIWVAEIGSERSEHSCLTFLWPCAATWVRFSVSRYLVY